MAFFIIFLILLILALPGKLASAAEVIDEVVATVNGQIITQHQLQEEIYIFKQEKGGEVSSGSLKREILDRMIEECLLEQEAKEEGFTVSAMEVEETLARVQKGLSREQFIQELERRGITLHRLKERLKGRILREKLVKWKANRLQDQIRIEKSEVEEFFLSLKNYLQGREEPDQSLLQFYSTYREKLAEEERIHLAQIIVKGEKEAKKILQKLSQGQNFSNLAIQFSQGPNAAKGGELGWFRLAQLQPPLPSIVGELPEGGVTEPIKVNGDYYRILQVKQRRELLLQDWKIRIENYLFHREMRKLLQEWLSSLKEESFIQIVDEALKEG